MKRFFLGEVIHPISIYSRNEVNAPEFLKDSSREFAIVSYQIYRNILFFLNAQKHGVDLYFDSPTYPIVDFSQPDEILTANILIQNPRQLEETDCSFFYDNQSDLFLPHSKEGKILSRSLEQRKKSLDL